jgi:hypothetical protein
MQKKSNEKLAAALVATLGLTVVGGQKAFAGNMNVIEKSVIARTDVQLSDKGKEGSCKGKEGSCKGKEKGKEGSCKGKEGSCKGKEGSCKGKEGSCKGKEGSCKGKDQ